jgi:flagellar biosynthesis/type III secretory pathway M-ring protein FliF/YscJ
MPIWLVVAAAVVVFGGTFLGLRTVRRYRTEASSEEAQFADLEAARTAAKAPDDPGDPAPGPKAGA